MTEAMQESIQNYAALLEAIYYMVTIIGIPFITGSFVINIRRQRREHERSIFDTLDDVYVHFNELMLLHTDLGVSEYDPTFREDVTEEQRIRQGHLFSILAAMFERAFLTYLNASGKQRKRQWNGWAMHIRQYARNENFQNWWKHNKYDGETLGFDRSFEKYIEKTFAEVGK